MGARHYDPKVGRFLSPDPVGHPLCLNLYSYANGDPINYIDPDGRFCVDAWHNPRVRGSIQAVGGLSEIGVGAGVTIKTAGIASAVGWPIMAHGFDQFITGGRAVITGQYSDTATSQLLQKTGISSGTANIIDTLGSVAGVGIGIRMIKHATTFTTPRFFKSQQKNVSEIPQNHDIGYSGRKGFELKNPEYQKIRNNSLAINDRVYANHALDQMQNRGFLPSTVENTIKNGIKTPNKVPGRVQIYDPVNNISVVTENETVITITYGELGP